MAKNKGKPSGTVARDKKDAGKQGDIKEIGFIAGAQKKKLSRSAGIVGVTGAQPRRRPKEKVH